MPTAKERSAVADDEFVKLVESGVPAKEASIRVEASRRPKRSRMPRSGPGWAQLLINDIGRILAELRALDVRLRSLENLFRQSLTKSGASDERRPPYGGSVEESIRISSEVLASEGRCSSDSIEE